MINDRVVEQVLYVLMEDEAALDRAWNVVITRFREGANLRGPARTSRKIMAAAIQALKAPDDG